MPYTDLKACWFSKVHSKNDNTTIKSCSGTAVLLPVPNVRFVHRNELQKSPLLKEYLPQLVSSYRFLLSFSISADVFMSVQQ